MNLDQLRYFAEAARHEHIGKAARVLAISPSAVSHAIANLEEQLGQSLFTRQGKRVFLTVHGKRLAEGAADILGTVGRLHDELRAETIDAVGTCRIAGTHSLASSVLAPAWMRVRERHSKITAEIYSRRTADVVHAVAAREVDFGLGFSPFTHPDIHAEPMARGCLVVALREGHPLLDVRADRRASMLDNYPLAAAKSFVGVENCETHPVLREWNVTNRASLLFDNYDVAIRCLLASDAWALLPEWVCERRGGALRVALSTGDKGPVTIMAMWPKTCPPTRVLRDLIAELPRAIEASRRGRSG